MHLIGSEFVVTATLPDMRVIPIIRLDEWDFDWQLAYQLSSPVEFYDGDQLSLTCTFDNTEEGAVRTNWGEGTDDEMCVANLYIAAL